MRKTKILLGTLLATFSLAFLFRFCLFYQPSKEKYWQKEKGAYIKRQLKDKHATFSETHQSYFGINFKTYLAESGEYASSSSSLSICILSSLVTMSCPT